jgi:hypothetical protein
VLGIKPSISERWKSFLEEGELVSTLQLLGLDGTPRDVEYSWQSGSLPCSLRPWSGGGSPSPVKPIGFLFDGGLLRDLCSRQPKCRRRLAGRIKKRQSPPVSRRGLTGAGCRYNVRPASKAVCKFAGASLGPWASGEAGNDSFKSPRGSGHRSAARMIKRPPGNRRVSVERFSGQTIDVALMRSSNHDLPGTPFWSERGGLEAKHIDAFLGTSVSAGDNPRYSCDLSSK